MTYVEYLGWVAYRQKRGSLHPGMRVEHGAALIASTLANVHRERKKPPFKLIDFMPHQSEAPISLEDAMATWR